MIHPLDALKIAGTKKLAKEYRRRLENATGREMAISMLHDAICAGNKKVEHRLRGALLTNHNMTRLEVDYALSNNPTHF